MTRLIHARLYHYHFGRLVPLPFSFGTSDSHLQLDTDQRRWTLSGRCKSSYSPAVSGTHSNAQPLVNLAVISVTKGKRYRFAWSNCSSTRVFLIYHPGSGWCRSRATRTTYSGGINAEYKIVNHPDCIFSSIDGHQLTIIEVDGVNVQPFTVDSIQIFGNYLSYLRINILCELGLNFQWRSVTPSSSTRTSRSAIIGSVRSPTSATQPSSTG